MPFLFFLFFFEIIIILISVPGILKLNVLSWLLILWSHSIVCPRWFAVVPMRAGSWFRAGSVPEVFSELRLAPFSLSLHPCFKGKEVIAGRLPASFWILWWWWCCFFFSFELMQSDSSEDWHGLAWLLCGGSPPSPLTSRPLALFGSVRRSHFQPWCKNK